MSIVAGDTGHLDAHNAQFRLDDFGSVGDGIADDLPKILDAIAALPAAGGTIVLGAGKDYFCSDTLFVPPTAGSKPVNIVGQGLGPSLATPGSRLTFPTGIEGVVIQARNCSLRNLEVIQQGGAKTVTGDDHGIRFAAATDSRLVDVDVRHFGGHGIDYATPLNPDNNHLYFENVRSIENGKDGFSSRASGIQNRCTFVHCNARQNGWAGFYEDGSHNLWLHPHTNANDRLGLGNHDYHITGAGSTFLMPYIEGGRTVFFASAAKGNMWWQPNHYASTDAQFVFEAEAARRQNYVYRNGQWYSRHGLSIRDIDSFRWHLASLVDNEVSFYRRLSDNGPVIPIWRVLAADLDFRPASNLVIETVGKGVKIAEGSSARMGVATLVNGTVTVPNTTVTANTRIFLTRRSFAGTVRGMLEAGTVVPGTSFDIDSRDSAGSLVDDDSVVAWQLVEPA